ncbi:MAG: AAA family ATPase [Pseudonocardiaceae bacterium]
MIVAMAGLPGVGKSTLAHALAGQLGAVVLDKDRIRAGLFPPPHLQYSREQDDFCIDVMYRTAGWLLRRDPSTTVVLDGSTYTRAARVRRLRQVAAVLGTELRLIECVCRPELAEARINDDRAAGNHPAANRDPSLHRSIRGSADPISPPKLVVDTGRPVAACLAECLPYLAVGTP